MSCNVALSIVEQMILNGANWKEVQRILLAYITKGALCVYLFNRHSYDELKDHKYTHEGFVRALHDGHYILLA